MVCTRLDIDPNRAATPRSTHIIRIGRAGEDGPNQSVKLHLFSLGLVDCDAINFLYSTKWGVQGIKCIFFAHIKTMNVVTCPTLFLDSWKTEIALSTKRGRFLFSFLLFSFLR